MSLHDCRVKSQLLLLVGWRGPGRRRARRGGRAAAAGSSLSRARATQASSETD